MTARLQVRAKVERWPLAEAFVIARGAKQEAIVVVVEVRHGGRIGRGECVPYARYGETVESVVAAIESLALEAPDRAALQRLMPAGAARNAVDCALWDLEAKTTGVPAATRAGIAEIRPVTTMYTLSLGAPERMAEAAKTALTGPLFRGVERPLLKVKLGGDGDAVRIQAVRKAADKARLVVDANEAWNETNFAVNLAACRDAGVELIEQPLPAGKDDSLRDIEHHVPICADESLHVAADLASLRGKYDAVNVKLDKTGGLTEALALMQEAARLGFKTLVGCMVGTSLGMAPALILAAVADFVDLDGPLLLAKDRVPGLAYSGTRIEPPTPDLWG